MVCARAKHRPKQKKKTKLLPRVHGVRESLLPLPLPLPGVTDGQTNRMDFFLFF
jgi:hypothetical protein